MLAGEASQQELAELERLLRSNPDLHYPLQIISGLWGQSGPEEQKKAEEAFARHLDRMTTLQIAYGETTLASELPARTGIRNRRLLIGAAGVCAGAIAVIVGTFLSRPRPIPPIVNRPIAAQSVSEVVTREGLRTNTYLPDGTRVWLNAASKLTYAKDFGVAGVREVTLTGEAYFDVTHNSARPFVIHAAHVDIKVLGTSFNIKAYPTEKTTEAVLVRGSIEVDIRNNTNKKIILKPNEKLIVDNDDSLTVQRRTAVRKAGNLVVHSPVTILKPSYEPNTGAMVETSWVNDKLIFQEEAFGDLARQMERWYGVTIGFTRPELEQLQFTGSFEQETIKQALDALKLTATFNYSISGNHITIY